MDQYIVLAIVSGIYGFFATIESIAYMTAKQEREASTLFLLCQSWCGLVYVGCVGAFMIPLKYTMDCTWIVPFTGSLFVFYHGLSLLYFCHKGIRREDGGARIKVTLMLFIFSFILLLSPLVNLFVSSPGKDYVTFACFDLIYLPWILTTSLYWFMISILGFLTRYSRSTLTLSSTQLNVAYILYTCILTGCVGWIYHHFSQSTSLSIPVIYVDWISMTICQFLLRCIDHTWVPAYCSGGGGRQRKVYHASSRLSTIKEGDEVEDV
jgi:hypothetical protein